MKSKNKQSFGIFFLASKHTNNFYHLLFVQIINVCKRKGVILFWGELIYNSKYKYSKSPGHNFFGHCVIFGRNYNATFGILYTSSYIKD